MKHTRISGLMTAVLAAMFSSGSIGELAVDVSGPQSKPRPRSTAGGASKGNRSGKRYPEQSARQALRGMRRAQGGPGITEGSDPQPLAA